MIRLGVLGDVKNYRMQDGVEMWGMPDGGGNGGSVERCEKTRGWGQRRAGCGGAQEMQKGTEG